MKGKLGKSIFFIALILLASNIVAFAQEKIKEEKTFRDKIFFGGSIGMVFGTTTRVDILPEVGMWVIPQWSIGFGGRYTFRKDRYNFINGESNSYKAHIWGVSGFTQILPIPDLDKAFKIGIHGGPIFQGEWEGLYMDKGTIDPTAFSPGHKGWVHIILVGAGYRFPLGERASLNLLVMWDLTNNKYSPYTTNPLLRLNINF